MNEYYKQPVIVFGVALPLLAVVLLFAVSLHYRSKFEADYRGFEIEDLFVVGYGLDYDNLYRELPHIAKVNFRKEPC